MNPSIEHQATAVARPNGEPGGRRTLVLCAHCGTKTLRKKQA